MGLVVAAGMSETENARGEDVPPDRFRLVRHSSMKREPDAVACNGVRELPCKGQSRM
jgi:hypothetical protein